MDCHVDEIPRAIRFDLRISRMKRLINKPGNVVTEMVEGMAMANGRLAIIDGFSIVVRRDFAALRDAGVVALISGGGAGHEPAHAGYVGSGMLTAAVSGPVFTSPSVDAVLQAILTVGGPAGVLLLVKNYTGDRLNFGMAAEIARMRGINVEMVLIGDDVAVEHEQEGVGRRGIAGTVFVHKIAGAAAASGFPLSGVRRLAAQATANLFSMGVGLSTCTVPGGVPGFTLDEDEVEFGLGIHGESGVRRAPLEAADQIVGSLVAILIARARVVAGTRLALLVNNLGATSPAELAIVARQALRLLHAAGAKTERVLVGTFLTALDMAGCSLSVLRLDDETDAFLMAPAEASAWVHPVTPAQQINRLPAVADLSAAASPAGPRLDAAPLREHFAAAIHGIAAAVSAAEPMLTQLDAIVGDGDLGISLARGADAVAARSGAFDLDYPANVLRLISHILRETLGGTSGPLYSIFVLRAATVLEEQSDLGVLGAWTAAFRGGCEAVQALGGAAAGDRTMLDALLPALASLEGAAAEGASVREAMRRAVTAAEVGAEAARQMPPRRGRSSYIGTRVIGHEDPGARAVVIWLEALAKVFGT